MMTMRAVLIPNRSFIANPPGDAERASRRRAFGDARHAGLPPPSSIVRRLARGRSIEGLAIEVNNAGRLTAFC
jgi:hypothetical protein